MNQLINQKKLDYECHITIDTQGQSPAAEHAVHETAAQWSWKVSFIDGDPVLGPGKRFFLTNHSTDFAWLLDEMHGVAAACLDIGLNVVREKIELIVYDTKEYK